MNVYEMASAYLKNLEVRHKKLVAEMAMLETHMEECKEALITWRDNGPTE